MTADLILHNGRIHTVDRERPSASAVAVRDGRFVAVGDNATVMAQRGGTGLELGVPPALGLFLDGTMLREALRGVIFAAVRAAPGGMVRIAAANPGQPAGKSPKSITRPTSLPVPDFLAVRSPACWACLLMVSGQLMAQRPSLRLRRLRQRPLQLRWLL